MKQPGFINRVGQYLFGYDAVEVRNRRQARHAGGLNARRSEYWGRMVQKCPGLRADGTPYATIIRRRCRCLDCGQVRIDKEYA